MDRVGSVVVGAGVVGLAVARALAEAGREVVLLEREGLIDLFERKGAGRTTTVRIRNPPPYPLD